MKVKTGQAFAYRLALHQLESTEAYGGDWGERNTMFGFLKGRRKREREAFDVFVLEKTREDPSISLEDVLNQYIKKYVLAVRHRLDEPATVTAARTKLHILEECISEEDPEKCLYADEKLLHYLKTLRETVKMFDSLPRDVLKRMKEREQNS